MTDLPVLHTAKRLKLEARKLDGMQRELYSLIGENSAPVVVAPDSKFKTKPGFKQKAASWKLVEVHPKPGLVLHHWARAALVTGNVDVDRFARFNTPFEIINWEDSDYESFESEDWSLQETRYLFDLIETFELRWFVIADRYNYPGKTRSLEDLKERYYEVCTKIMQRTTISKEIDAGPQNEQLIAAMRYPKEHEIKRKSHLEQLLARTPKEVAEEEALVLESRKLEVMAEKLLGERREILQLLDSPQAISSRLRSDLNTSQGVTQLLAELQSEKDKKAAGPSTKTSEPETPAPTDTSVVARTVRRKLSTREMSAYGISYLNSTSQKHTGVYLRSSKITPVRQSVLPKVRNIANELGLPLKPVMPTARICLAYDNLLQEINLLLEAKKVSDRLKMEVEVLKKSHESASLGPEESSVVSESGGDSLKSSTSVDEKLEPPGQKASSDAPCNGSDDSREAVQGTEQADHQTPSPVTSKASADDEMEVDG